MQMEQLQKDMIAAMKARDKVRRMLYPHLYRQPKGGNR